MSEKGPAGDSPEPRFLTYYMALLVTPCLTHIY